LSIRTEDIARFGQLYLRKGQWQGQQLIPAAWVEAATARQTSNGSNPKSDWDQGYGYQFWRCRHGVYRGDGAFGQFCLVFPEQDAVLAITAGVDNLQGVLDHVWNTMLPALGPVPLPENPGVQMQLARKLENLAYPAPAGDVGSPLQAAISGTRYALDANPAGIESVRFDFTEEGCLIKLKDGVCEEQAACGRGAWREGVASMVNHRTAKEVASGVWTSVATFTATLRFYETPFTMTITAQFHDERIQLDMKINVSVGPSGFPPLEGHLI